MPEPKHTPGPWEDGEWDDDGDAVCVWAYRDEADDEGVLIATVSGEDVGPEAADANARLIAAAPDLLAAVLEAHALILFAMTPRPAHMPGPSPAIVGEVLDRLHAAGIKAGATYPTACSPGNVGSEGGGS